MELVDLQHQKDADIGIIYNNKNKPKDFRMDVVLMLKWNNWYLYNNMF